jgi:hypothetical protein
MSIEAVLATPNSRTYVAITPLLSHATARPRQAGTSFGSQAKPAARRLESQPTGTSQRYDLTHCHPGQAAPSTSESQLGGYVRVREMPHTSVSAR